MSERETALERDIIARCERLQITSDGDAPPPILVMARRLAEVGLLGLTIPVDREGRGEGVLAAVIALEETGRRCPAAVDALYMANFSAVRMLAEAAEEELRARLLTDALAGRAILPMAISEAGAGSSAADLATCASTDGDAYRVSGSKRFTPYIDDASHIAVGLRFGLGVETIGAAVLPKDAGGLALGPPRRFMSGEIWREMALDDVRVPRADVIMEGGLFTRWGRLFDCDKLGTAARALGVAMHAFDAARAYAVDRRQFGRALCEFQGLQMKFGAMDARLTAARLVLRTAASECDRGGAIGRNAAMAKLLCAEAALSVCGEVVQIMGATGTSDGSPVEYCLRKAQGLAVTSGTLDLMKVKLAESVFGRAFPQAVPSP